MFGRINNRNIINNRREEAWRKDKYNVRTVI
jgi:hypothetical protein